MAKSAEIHNYLKEQQVETHTETAINKVSLPARPSTVAIGADAALGGLPRIER